MLAADVSNDIIHENNEKNTSAIFIEKKQYADLINMSSIP